MSMKPDQIFQAIADDVVNSTLGGRRRGDCHGKTAQYIVDHPENTDYVIKLLGRQGVNHVVHSVVTSSGPDPEIVSDTAPDGGFDTGGEYVGSYKGANSEVTLVPVGEMTIGSFIDKYIHGKYLEANQSISQGENPMKRKLSYVEARTIVRMLPKTESNKAVKILTRENDGEFEGPEGSVYAEIDPASLQGSEITIGSDGGVCIGPFPDEAAAAEVVGPDVALVSGDGAEVAPPADDEGAFEDDFPSFEAVTKRFPSRTVESMRKDFRTAVMKEADGYTTTADTSVGTGDTATELGAGELNRSGPPGVANQSPADIAKSVGTSENPDDKPNTDGIDGAEKTGTDGTLISNGGSDGLTESAPAGLSLGSFTLVKEKSTNKQIDSGMVTKIEGRMVSVGKQQYDSGKYSFVNLS